MNIGAFGALCEPPDAERHVRWCGRWGPVTVLAYPMMTQICATVIGKDVEAIRHARAAVEADADLVELRLDSMDRPDPAGALEGRRKPAIVTCRPLREGGMFGGTEEERLRILRDAHALGAEFIDVEWDADFRSLVDARGGRG